MRRGIIFNHVNSLVVQAYIMLRILWPTQLHMPLNTRILIAKTHLIPLLYGCELFRNCNSSSKRKLFNNIADYNLRRCDHIPEYSCSFIIKKANNDLFFDRLIEFLIVFEKSFLASKGVKPSNCYPC